MCIDRHPWVLLSVLFSFGFLAGCGCESTKGDTGADYVGARPAKWAQPIAREGLPNFYKVSDELYRGAQPTEEGFAALHEMGIKTVVSLRTMHSDKDKMKDAGVYDKMGYKRISFKAWHAEDEDIVKFLTIMADPERKPVFVHCKHGSDRTGTACAVYRIIVEGWSKEDALEEMTKGGYGFHKIWENLPEYIEDLDIKGLKEKSGLE